jgi:hypothetical protein
MTASSALIVSTYFAVSTFEVGAAGGGGLAALDDAGFTAADDAEGGAALS